MSVVVTTRRRRPLRSLVALLAIALAIFAIARLFVPQIVRIRGDAMAPVVRAGDWVVTRPVRGEPRRGSIVLITAPLAARGSAQRALAHMRRIVGDGVDAQPPGDRTVARRIVAVAGDRVTYDESRIMVQTPSGDTVTYERDLLAESLRTAQYSRLIGPESVFVSAARAGHADSRELGTIASDSVRDYVTRIVWPAERRGAPR